MGLPAVNIFLPIIFTGRYLKSHNIVGMAQVSMENVYNVIEIDPNFKRKITIPEKIHCREVDLSLFKTERAKIKYSFRDEKTEFESAVVADRLSEEEEALLRQVQHKCLIVLNQDHRLHWCCQINHLIKLENQQISVKCDINEFNRMQVEMLLHPEAVEPDIQQLLARELVRCDASARAVFGHVIQACKANQLWIHVPIDILIESYREYVQQADENVVQNHFFNNEEYTVEITRFVLYHVNNFILVPDDMRVVSVNAAAPALPAFAVAPGAGLGLAQKALRSDALDALSVRIESYSQNNSTHNSYIQQHSFGQGGFGDGGFGEGKGGSGMEVFG